MRKLILERRFFKVLSDGSNEFDWILGELGIPQNEHADIEDVEIEATVLDKNVNV